MVFDALARKKSQRLDELHIQNASFLLDIRTMLRMIGIVWFGDGLGSAGQAKFAIRAASNRADKSWRRSQAWSSGLAARRVLSRFVSTPSCTTGGKGFIDRPSLPSRSRSWRRRGWSQNLVGHGPHVSCRRRQSHRLHAAYLARCLCQHGTGHQTPRAAAATRPGWAELDRRIAAFDAEFVRWAKENEEASRLTTIPGFGPIIASALVAAVGRAESFDHGRDLAAWLGLVPRQFTTGVGRWAKELMCRTHRNVAVVALANKLARIAWAVLQRGKPFDAKSGIRGRVEVRSVGAKAPVVQAGFARGCRRDGLKWGSSCQSGGPE
jgi:Transposase IS116/IS110/IS902 family